MAEVSPHDQLFRVLCPGGKTVPGEVAAGGIFPEPHPVIAGHGHYERVCFLAVVVLRQEIAVMDGAFLAVQKLLPDKAGLHGRQVGFCWSGETAFPDRNFRSR